MPLIDLDSLSGEQLKEEARQWSLEPSNYKNDKELKAAIKGQRETRAARHPVYQAEVDAGEAKAADLPGQLEDKVPKDKDPKVIDSVQKATITRPTPGEPEQAQKKAEESQKQVEAQDNSTDTQDTNKEENPTKDVVNPKGTGKTVKKDEVA